MSTNHLAQEKSPYLLQHQHNPVNWYAWGEEAFQAARAQSKPIFLSIGYSTCYWCHVMEKDSFENKDVAKVLNDHFISIKVDREERPDVDSIYMNAVVSLTGQGGWPLSVFLTTDLKPFFGGTFFPKAQFVPLLQKISETWESRRDAVIQTSEQLTEIIRRAVPASPRIELNSSLLAGAFRDFSRSFDSQDGGFGTAPKFPPSMGIRLLLRLHRRSGNEDALKMAVVTLEKMARGGMYDHLGGGFHRYSTDSRWLVPHFEKMLYDNALLSTAYLEAYQATKNEMFAAVARETLDYVLRDMMDPLGGFYSAEDAGEVGKEGEFYVWTQDELKKLLSAAELAEITRLYGISSGGNFEHGHNILHLQDAAEWADKTKPVAAAAAKKLFEARNRRMHPHRDDKVLTSWNGLMIAALAKGSLVLGELRYLEAAVKAAGFIERSLYREKRLLRRYRDADSRFDGYVDDYAFFINGLLELYQADFDPHWLRLAEELQTRMDELLWDPAGSGYYFSSAGDASIISRRKEFTDGAEPSGNSIALLNLLRLADLTLNQKYRDRAQQQFEAGGGAVAKYPSAFSSYLTALDYKLGGAKEIAVVGERDAADTKKFLSALAMDFLPNKVLAYGVPAGLDDHTAIGIFRGKQVLNSKPTFYICEEGKCKLPTNDPAKALELAKEFEKLSF